MRTKMGRDSFLSVSAGAVLARFLPSHPTQEKLHVYILRCYIKAMISVAGPSLAVENHVWQWRTGRQATSSSRPDDQRYLQFGGQRPVVSQPQLETPALCTRGEKT